LARFHPDVARTFLVAGFVALRVELFPDFVATFRFGVDFGFFAGVRFFAAPVEARFLQPMLLPLGAAWSADF
jgi:hypothetical protein